MKFVEDESVAHARLQRYPPSTSARGLHDRVSNDTPQRAQQGGSQHRVSSGVPGGTRHQLAHHHVWLYAMTFPYKYWSRQRKTTLRQFYYHATHRKKNVGTDSGCG